MIKNLEMSKNIFFKRMKKNDKFAKKKVLVSLEEPMETSEHIKTFFGKIFNIFSLTIIKIYLPSFQD